MLEIFGCSAAVSTVTCERDQGVALQPQLLLKKKEKKKTPAFHQTHSYFFLLPPSTQRLERIPCEPLEKFNGL
jgi:hypothetical protein